MQNIFKFRCPVCQKKHGVPAEYIGKVVMCNGCNERIHVVEDQPAAPRSYDPTDTAVSAFFDGDDLSGQWQKSQRKRRSAQASS